MAQRTALTVVAAALLLLSGCAAQNNLTRASSGLGSADATAQSQQIIVPGNGGQLDASANGPHHCVHSGSTRIKAEPRSWQSRLQATLQCCWPVLGNA